MTFPRRHKRHGVALLAPACTLLIVAGNGLTQWCSAALAQARAPGPQPPISAPYGTAAWLLHYLLALVVGLGFLLIVNRLSTRRGFFYASESLAKEAARLRRLVIGYPEGMTIFEQLRSSGLLEKRFSSLGLVVEWRHYPSASSLLNDLSQGVIQFCGGGGTASIFSQHAHHVFVRVAREKYPETDAEAILVPFESKITHVGDLKGKRVAFDEGSSAHYVLLRALESAGLSFGDIEPCMLPQEDVLPLFAAGRVDAWVVWMPYALTDVRRSYPGRSIGNLHSILGQSALGLAASAEVPTLYYAVPELVRDYPRILKAILEEVNEAGVLVNQERLENALTDVSGVTDRTEPLPSPPPDLEFLRQRSLERALVPLDEATLVGLQRQASLFYRFGVLHERVNVRDAAYSLRMRQNWTY